MPWDTMYWDAVFEGMHHTGSTISKRSLSTYTLGIAKNDPTPGRRLRVFSCLISFRQLNSLEISGVGMSMLDAYDVIKTIGKCFFNDIALMTSDFTYNMYESNSKEYLNLGNKQPYADPSLHLALQDLAWTLSTDLTAACEAISNPDVWYPGVDDGITPVTDDHVDLVIWGAQRELNRELRGRPAVNLVDLPQHIKRAYAERRRLRYSQWGITSKVWKEQKWSLWDVPEDPDWIPSWTTA